MYQALFHKIHESKANLLIIKLNNLISNIKNPSETESDALNEARVWKYYKNPKRKQELAQHYPEYENDDDKRLILDFELSGLKLVTKNGLVVLADMASKYYLITHYSQPISRACMA